MSLYDTLGVPSDASEGDIKRAYKRKAHSTHPDKEGGSKEAFQELSKAYALLSDKTKRKKYDETGSTDTTDKRGQMLHELASLLLQIIDGIGDVVHTDLVFQMEQSIDAGIRQHQQAHAQIQHAIKKRELVLERLNLKSEGGSNLLVSVIEADIRDRKAKMVQIQGVIDHGVEMKTILLEYKYRVDEIMVRSNGTTTATMGTGGVYFVRTS